MTEHDYVSMRREIKRLERTNPLPHHSSNAAVKLYTLKAAAMAYEQGLYPDDDIAPPGFDRGILDPGSRGASLPH